MFFLTDINNDYLYENVEKEDISLSSFKVRSKLQPDFWKDNGKLNGNIRKRLLSIADEFLDGCDVRWTAPVDIVLTGSIANYNWSKYSDVDLHIRLDFDKIWNKKTALENFFKARKALWDSIHDGLTIYGFPVEVYVEDINAPHHSSGMYSVKFDKWIVEPSHPDNVELEDDEIRYWSAKYMNEIDALADELDSTDDRKKCMSLESRLNTLFKRIRQKRTTSLEKKGEYGALNIVWKVLRRNGYVEKLVDLRNKAYDKANSIS